MAAHNTSFDTTGESHRKIAFHQEKSQNHPDNTPTEWLLIQRMFIIAQAAACTYCRASGIRIFHGCSIKVPCTLPVAKKPDPPTPHQQCIQTHTHTHLNTHTYAHTHTHTHTHVHTQRCNAWPRSPVAHAMGHNPGIAACKSIL
jgi:hypothetical protein